MKPPQEQAVARALSVLMGSVGKENDAEFVCTKFSAAFAPLSSLPDNAEALELAKLYINGALNTLISRMQHRRNLAASIHKLPIEVLVMIFAAYSRSTPLSNIPSLLDLMTVNRLWYKTILHSSQLWTVLESDFTPKITRLVLQRSGDLPLSLFWNSTRRNSNEEEELEELLEIAFQNSERLRSISMTVPEWCSRSIRRLLESNLPQLERLDVETVQEDNDSEELLDEFKLSDGSSLRKIALNRIHPTSWSSPRLRGLFALDLIDLRQSPSIERLLDILSNSPQLERLRLCQLGYLSSPWKGSKNGLIILPHLKEVLLKGIHAPFLSVLLTSVCAPSCSNVSIHGYLLYDDSLAVLEEIWLPGHLQLAAWLGLGDSGSPALAVPVTIVVASTMVQIIKTGDAQKREMVLQVFAPLSQVVDILGRLFVALSQIPPIDMRIGTAASDWKNAALDLMPWSRSLRTLSVHEPVVCRQVLKQLAERKEDPTTGVLTWVCPNLTSIQLCYLHSGAEAPELDGQAIEALVRARWAESGAVVQLSEFMIRCEEERYPSIWSRGDVLKKAMPSISLSKEPCRRS